MTGNEILKINKIHNVDCLEFMKTMPDKSVNCFITSPPYWQLRDYGYPEQWGLEPTYQKYLGHLWSLMDEIWRVLKDDGTVWVNLGDTYGTVSGRMGNDELQQPKFSDEANKTLNFHQPKSIHKCLLLIPHRFAIGCIERNWIVRNDIIWAKRNGMPESVTDRFSKKHEYFFFMVKQRKYYFDLDGVRDVPVTKEIGYDSKLNKMKNISGSMTKDGLTRTTAGLNMKTAQEKINPKGKNPGDVSDFWDVPTKPSSTKHYATFNTDLIDKPIIAGCPEDGIIVDPFCGTGTTLIRGLQLGRKVIGCDGSKKYCDIAEKRIENVLKQQRDGKNNCWKQT